MMNVAKMLVVGIAISGSYWTGGNGVVDHRCSVGENEMVDSTGRTSIVIEYNDPNNWCELRGPGRFEVLNDFMG